MTSAEYKAARVDRGSQQKVADALGVHRMTIAKRESGANPIDREAEIALLSLPKKVQTIKV